jgi:hypothetical protein
MARDATGSACARQHRVGNARERTAIDRERAFAERKSLLSGAAPPSSVHDMSRRSLLPLAAVVAAAGLTASPANAQTPTDQPAPGATPGACMDLVSPSSGFTRRAARRASHRRIIRGTARDVGCGLDRVAIAVARKHRGRCRLLTAKKRLTHRTRCRHHRWLRVRGTTHWSFRLPKRLPNGVYVIRTRAVDFAGNRQRPRRHVIRLR